MSAHLYWNRLRSLGPGRKGGGGGGGEERRAEKGEGEEKRDGQEEFRGRGVEWAGGV